MRVVLYAEGPNETGAIEMPPLFARRSRIADDDLGPAHILTRRCVALTTNRDAASIQFQAPLLVRGKSAKGSQLLDSRVLERLLTWTHPKIAPDLAVILVDQDGAEARRTMLKSIVDQRRLPQPPVVIAIAVQEFEAWLLADLKPLIRILDRKLDQLSDLEQWKSGEAKRWLLEQLGRLPADELHQVRRMICLECNLDLIGRSSSSFRSYLDDLRHASKSIA